MTTLVDPYIASGKPLPFGQLQLEIHIWDRSFEYFLTWWEKLEKAGLRPFWTEASCLLLSVGLSNDNNNKLAKSNLSKL